MARFSLKDICRKIVDGSHNPPAGVSHSQYLMISSKNVGDDNISFDEPRYLSEPDFEVENRRTHIEPDDLLLTIVGTVGRIAIVPQETPIVDGKICIDPKLTISDEKYGELASYALQVGDIVLGRRGEMGRCAVVYEDGLLCGTGSMTIRPNGKMLPYFLQNILSNPTYRRIIEDKAVGVTMMNLNVPIVSELSVPLLPLKLQEDFIGFLGKVDKSKLTIQQSLDKLELLKKALMQEYFGGKNF